MPASIRCQHFSLEFLRIAGWSHRYRKRDIEEEGVVAFIDVEEKSEEKEKGKAPVVEEVSLASPPPPITTTATSTKTMTCDKGVQATFRIPTTSQVNTFKEIITRPSWADSILDKLITLKWEKWSKIVIKMGDVSLQLILADVMVHELVARIKDLTQGGNQETLAARAEALEGPRIAIWPGRVYRKGSSSLLVIDPSSASPFFCDELPALVLHLVSVDWGKILTRRAKPFPQVPSASVSSNAGPEHSPTSAYSSIAFIKETHSSTHLALILGVGIGVTGVALAFLLLLIFLIHRKRKELKNNEVANISHWNRTLISSSCRKLQKWRKGGSNSFRRQCMVYCMGLALNFIPVLVEFHTILAYLLGSIGYIAGQSSMFRRFSHKEIRRATDDFSTIIGRGGFGTVYRARFKDGLVAAVKRMNKVSQQDEFCKEMELLGQLHHRHLVTLIGFCAERHERFLIYEYMENGSLKEHLHAPIRTHLNWRIRLQIAVDVAAALEYLHFYCDPPLCHRDIKSSNILLDENFVAKVSDFGLAHAAPSGANNFEPINTDVRGTPGYMDPEYLITQELTEKSDVYSYGVLLLELITARQAVHDNKNLVEWAQKYILDDTILCEMVDPDLENTYDLEEIQGLVSIVTMCTQRRGKSRPSIRHVLQLLYERLDIASPNPAMATPEEDEDADNCTMSTSKGKIQIEPYTNGNNLSGEIRCIPSPNTSTSCCSRNFLLEPASPCSPE
eukprot:Gb_26358 [translate_table: standard]